MHRLPRRRSAACSSTTRLAAQLHTYLFFGDFVLLYPLYALLFADTGLSTAEISSLFVIWSVTSMALEIPSGVLADVTSRRLLLIIGPLLTAVGYGLWTLAPSYPSFALGFVLWGAQGALRSGSLESLVYEELTRFGTAERYPQIMGRARAVSTVAVALAIGAAAPVFAIGGYLAAGAASALAGLVCAAVAVTFPEHRGSDARGARQGYRGYFSMLRQGVTEVRSRPSVRWAVLLAPAVSAIWGALDEYVPLLAADAIAREAVPLLILMVYVGLAVGGLLGGVAHRLSARGLAGLLAVAAAALAVGALSRHAWGFGLIAVAFCLFQAADVTAETRLQNVITGPARSTVTSLAGFGAEVATIGVFAGYAASSAAADHSTIFAACAAAYGIVALWLFRRPRSGAWAGRTPAAEKTSGNALVSVLSAAGSTRSSTSQRLPVSRTR